MSGRWVARIVRFFGSLPDPTLSGRVTIVFLFVGLWFPLLLHHNPLLFVVCTLLATVMASVVVTHLAVGRLTSERTMPDRVVAGELFEVSLSVRNRSRWRPAFRLRFRDALQGADPGELTCGPGVALLPPGGRVRITYTRRLQRRGIYPVTNSLVATRFPFGIFERRALVRSEGPDRIVVLPALGVLGRSAQRELARGLLARRTPQFGPEGHQEFHGLREYRQGDNPRHIHWRTSARAMTLMRRVMHAERGRDLIVFLDTCVAGLQADTRRRAFERAISCAATLLVAGARVGRRVQIIHAGGVARHDGTRRALLPAWEQLATIRPCKTSVATVIQSARTLGHAVLLISLQGKAPEARQALAVRGCRLAAWDASHPDFERVFARPSRNP